MTLERWAWRRPPKLSEGGRRPQSADDKKDYRPSSSFSLKTAAVFLFLAILGGALDFTDAVVPYIHQATIMSELRVPSDTIVGTRIYRLRATDADRDYPLIWRVSGSIGTSLIELKPHPCTYSNNIFCECDVHLRKSLEAGRVYIFNLTVADSRGDQTQVVARIEGTRGFTPLSSIFPKYDYSVIVPEDEELNKEIASILVNKKLSATFIHFDILGDSAHLFKINGKLVSSNEIRGTLMLENRLDYEKQNLHNIEVCAMMMEPPYFQPIYADENPYTDEEIDSRNIACVFVTIAVEDKQDQPPYFIDAPPVTKIPPTIQPGDVLVQLVAKDGDQGSSREIRFSMLPDSSEFAGFFKIDPFKGSIEMADTLLKLLETMTTMEPVVVTVTAEEVENEVSRYPALSTDVKLAFLVSESQLPLAQFLYKKYSGEIRENSPIDSQVFFTSAFIQGVSPDNKGVRAVYSISIEGDNGIFGVTPSVIRDNGDFIIFVKNSLLLDYETRKSVDFKLIARPVTGARQQSSTTEVTVKIIDENDNPPKFSQSLYTATIDEDARAGTKVVQVVAEDPDSGSFGTVRYPRVIGQMSNFFIVDPVSGWVTVSSNNHDFDVDHGSGEYSLAVEARDGDGSGNSVTVQLNIAIRDINDEFPIFKEDFYSGVLEPNFQKLRQAIRIEAKDDDTEAPNNQVVYEVETSTYSDYFTIGKSSGVLDVRVGTQLPVALHKEKALVRLDLNSRPKRQAFYDVGVDRTDFISLSVKATDLGNPPLSKVVPVKIYTKEYIDYITTFVYPQSQAAVRFDRKAVERTLNILTGAQTTIQRVEPYRQGLYGSEEDPSKSYLTVLVKNKVNNVIDVDAITKELNFSSGIVAEAQKTKEEMRILQESNTSYLAWVIVLCLLVAFLILTFAGCFMCAGCPLYRGRKQMSMVTDENGEGLSYIKMDEYGNVKPEYEKIWWDYLPTCLTDLFLSCGCRRPETGNYVSNSRMAWSANERSRYWRFQQQGEGALVDDRAMPRRGPRDMMQIDDMDEARLHRQNTVPNMAVRNDNMQQTGPNGEPRRVFVLKDPNGNPQVTDHLNEGETYLVEDVDETPRNIHLHDAQIENTGDIDYARSSGNEEPLRHHVGPRDAALLAEQFRRPKRAGEEPGGTQYGVDSSREGGTSSRYTDGQSNGVTPRDFENYPTNSNNYHQGGGGENMNVSESRRKQVDDTVTPRLRIQTPNNEEMMEDIQNTMNTKGKNAYRHDRPNFPGRAADVHGGYQKNNFGFQHTKSSILRYESNMSKLEEDQVREAEKDPLYPTLRMNSAVQAEARRAAQYASEDTTLATRRTLSQAALELNQSPSNYDSLERSGSVPNIETELEREAAIRRGSLNADELYEARKHAQNLSDDIKTKSKVPVEGEMSAEALKALEEEMKKDTDDGNDASKAAVDKSRKKRNQMTEKKSIFTIAYDDMQTNQLRPESAAPDP